MCSDDAPPAPTADPRIGQAAVEQAQLGRDQLAYAKELGTQQASLGQSYLDYAKSQGQAQTDLGQEYLAFAKNQFQISSALQADLNAKAKEVSDYWIGLSKEDRERYSTVFQPLQDQLIKDAKEWDSPERQAAAAAKAKADVATQSAIQRGTAERNMESVGIRPDSGRYAGVERAAGIGEALGSVDAENRARSDLRLQGTQLRGQAVAQGANLPGQSLAEGQVGFNAAGVPVQTQMAPIGILQGGYSQAAAGIGGGAGITGAGYGGAAGGLSGQSATGASGYAGALSGTAGEAATLNKQYSTDADVWAAQAKLDAANAAGIGQFAGSALGVLGGSGSSNSILGKGMSSLGLMFLSTKKAKTNRKDVPEGESLEAVKKMPIQNYDYKPGMGDGGSHVGPMAEDFQDATGKGDGTQIAAQDAIGIAMGAVKDLSIKVDKIAEAIGLGDSNAPRMAKA